jgi:hypothetical protein
MTNVVAGDASNTAGTEGYGIQSVVGASAGGRDVATNLFTLPVSVTAPYSTAIVPVPTVAAQQMISFGNSFAAPSGTTGSTLVTHFANINGGTPAGNYGQTVTYRVTATF